MALTPRIHTSILKSNRSCRLLCSCSETPPSPSRTSYAALQPPSSIYHLPYQPSQSDPLDSATSPPSPNPIHGINQSDASSIDPSPIRSTSTKPNPIRDDTITSKPTPGSRDVYIKLPHDTHTPAKPTAGVRHARTRETHGYPGQ